MRGEKCELVEAAQSLLANRLFPVGVELISSNVASDLKIDAPESQSVLIIRFAGTSKGVAWQTRQTLELLAGRDEAMIVADDQDLWRTLCAVPLLSTSALCFRISVLPSNLNKLLAGIAKVDGDRFQTARWQAGVGDGRLRVVDSRGYNSAQFDQVRSLVHSLNGNVFVEQSIGSEIEQRALTTTPLMDRVKQQLDPVGTFAV